MLFRTVTGIIQVAALTVIECLNLNERIHIPDEKKIM